METFNETFKWSLGAAKFRVFSCWEAIDRLLALAHLAYLVLYLMLVLSRSAVRGTWRDLWIRIHEHLRDWFARPPELTLGYFFTSVARDFGAGGAGRAAL